MVEALAALLEETGEPDEADEASPRPWVVADVGPYKGITIRTKLGRMIASVWTGNHDEAMPNARLIVAAVNAYRPPHPKGDSTR